MLDQIRGSACMNCESYSGGYLGPFCSTGCRDEWEGIGAYAEPDHRPAGRFAPRPAPTAKAAAAEPAIGELFARAALVEGEALRQWKAAQLPGQVDIWDACAEIATEQVETTAWPQPEGVLFDAEEMRGQLVLA